MARLATMHPPGAIPAARWAGLAAASAILLQGHGTKLHRAGWDALDLFGLHLSAPAAHPAGWGLAWLLESAGEVLDVTPEAVGMRRGPGGTRLTYRRPNAAARTCMVPAWSPGGG